MSPDPEALRLPDSQAVAVRGGKRSPQSSLLTTRTLTPPLSAARLQGWWTVRAKPIHHRLVGILNYQMLWQVTPGCVAGACDAKITVENRSHPFSVKLTRAGTDYRGRTVLGWTYCGPRGNTISDPTTLKIRLHITGGIGQGPAWAADSLTGTVTGILRYASAATYYCPTYSYKGSLTGTGGS